MNSSSKLFYLFLSLFSFSFCTIAEKTSEYKVAMISVLDYGADPSPLGDDSEAFRRAMESTNLVFIPEGVYKVRDLELNSRIQVVCASYGSIIEGVKATDEIFYSDNAVFLINIYGGTWQKAKSVVKHEGRGAFSASSFRGMYIRSIDTPFDISSSIGNRFLDIHFGAGCSVAIRFGTGGGQNNMNRIRDCNFLGFEKAAVVFEDTEDVKVQNIIDGCWFEDSEGSAILMKNGGDQLTIRNCYFERVGSKVNADIKLGDTTTSICRNTQIVNCSFQTPNKGQYERISVNGRSDIFALNNSSTLLENMTFITLNNRDENQQNILKDNYLNAIGGGKYKERLFSNTSNQIVDWNVRKGSGFVSTDELKIATRTQPLVKSSLLLGNTENPSISNGSFYEVSKGKPIRFFDGSIEGLEITLFATDQRRIVHGQGINLAGQKDLDVKHGDVIKLLYIEEEWIELFRRIKTD